MLEKFTNYIRKQSKWFWATVVTTLIVDAINTNYFEKIQSYFYIFLEGKDVKTMYLLIGVYTLFVVLLIFIGLMSTYGKRTFHGKKQKNIQKIAGYITGIMVFGFGIILMMPSISILGMGESTSVFSESEQQVYVGILIVLFFALVTMAFIEMEPRFIFGNKNYFYLYVPILILATLFVDFSTAMWKFQLFDPENVADPNRASRVIEFIAIFPLYAMFYSAPRFMLLRKSFSILPILSAVFSTAYFVWESLAYLEL